MSVRGARFCVDASDERGRNDHSVHEEEDMLIELWPSDENSVVEMIAEDKFKHASLAYITGYIVIKIERRVSCSPCANALRNNNADSLSQDPGNRPVTAQYWPVIVADNRADHRHVTPVSGHR